MTKEIKNITCEACDSTFKLIYTPEETSSYHKFCPFCAEPIVNDENEDEEYDIDLDD